MRKGFSGKIKLQKADLIESSEELQNPGCGWYHVYYFTVPKESGQKIWEDSLKEIILCKEEQLALALIDIGAFQWEDISAEGLSFIGHILQFFRQADKQLILRFAYDREGRGLEREPAGIGLIKRHMRQLQPLLGAYQDVIFVLQGLFVGNWGEMHGSKFLTDRYLQELAVELCEVTQGRCYLAVRTPAQWRKIVRGNADIFMPILALFNDGIFGSATDMGTYGTLSRQEAGENNSWSREEELAWQEEQLERMPNGGEILAGKPLVSYARAVVELQKMHVSYLNSVYQQEQLAHWRTEKVERQGCWNGLCGYEYIGRHLGYRFVVRRIKALSGNRLQILVENCGFASCCEQITCFLVIEEKDGKVSRLPIDTDPREWKSQKESLLEVKLPRPEGIQGPGRLSLTLERKRDARNIRFANQGALESVLLGSF